MSEGITADQLAPGVQTVLSQPFMIPHADILTLPTAPVLLKPATETYSYSGLPGEIFIPTGVNFFFDTRAGAYADVDALSYFVVGFGSDWSANWTKLYHSDIGSPLSNVGYRLVETSQLIESRTWPTDTANSGTNHYHGLQYITIQLNDALQDNAIILACSNVPVADPANFTGGNVANKIVGELLYTRKTLIS